MSDNSFENFIDMDFSNSASMEDHHAANGEMNLIPDECFKEVIKQDGSKSFICIRCDKAFKSAVSVKQHIKTIHKAKKRTAVQTDSVNKKASKKNKPSDITGADAISEKAQLSNTAFCEELLKEDGVYDEVLSCEDVEEFQLDTSAEVEASHKDNLHSTAVYYEESFLKSDQDHDFMLEEDNMKTLKIKVLTLELEIKRKDTDI